MKELEQLLQRKLLNDKGYTKISDAKIIIANDLIDKLEGAGIDPQIVDNLISATNQCNAYTFKYYIKELFRKTATKR